MNQNASLVSPVGTPHCPVCKSLQVSALCTVDGYQVWRCPESATDFVWPMPSANTLKTLYDREEWFEGGERGGYADYDAQTEPSLHLVKELLARFEGQDRELAVLDVGCGYGTHLRIAADQGWQCFGIETSQHARDTARERHGDLLTVVERAEDLLPKRFDLVLMFEVIEHLPDPYALLFTLFGRDAIGPETLLVISTPNARSHSAVSNPAAWAYRHPPSHLTFFSAKSLQLLLQRLLFKDIKVQGIVPEPATGAVGYGDEGASINDGTQGFMGILAQASGSTFKEFMHERYVPGAFWKLTEYEHFPRYGYAELYAKDARVLDFGCGTGYGTARLASVAGAVVGLDISQEAIAWARATHRNPKLQFEQRSDLGNGLPQSSFDLVTCFEMIEHVDHATQIATIASVSKLLKPGGKLVISTPDPQFTAAYGPNPYHLREMTHAEFTELLSADFKHVAMLKQWVRPSIAIGAEWPAAGGPASFGRLSETDVVDAPVGFVAVCSNEPFALPPYLCQFDTAVDFNKETLETEHKLNRLRFDNYKLLNDKKWLQAQRQSWEQLAGERDHAIADLIAQLQPLRDSNTWLAGQRASWEQLAGQRETTIASLQESIKTLHDQLAKQTQAVQWHDEQRQGWENLATERNRFIAELEAQINERTEAVVWLTGQRDAWKARAEAAEEHGTSLDSQISLLESRLSAINNELTVRTGELSERNIELSERNSLLDRIQAHWGMRLVNFLTGRKFFGRP